MADALVIKNRLGGVMVRRDNIPHTLCRRGYANWPATGGITGSGGADSAVPFSTLDITGINAPIIALRTRGDSDFVYGSTAYVDGRVYYHIFGSVSQQVEYFIFSKQSLSGGHSGLQVFKPDGGLAFDSTWPMLMPVGVYSVGRESYASHNLGHHPAFIQLNQPMYARSKESRISDGDHRYRKERITEGRTLALRVNGSNLRSGYINGIGNRIDGYTWGNTACDSGSTYTGPIGPDTLRALLINVNNL